MKHILNILRSFLIFLIIIVPTQLLSMILLGIWLPITCFTDKRIGGYNLIDQRLPRCFKWFDNGDNDDRHCGLNGDLIHQAKHLLNTEELLRPGIFYNAVDMIYDPEMEGKQVPWYKVFWMRYTWLALRNPVNYLKRRVLGVHKDNINQLIEYTQVLTTSNPDNELGDWHSPGYRVVTVEDNDEQQYSEYYIIKLLPRWMWSKGEPR